MRIGIVGAGSIAYGTAAFLKQQGHRPTLWSPSGGRARALAEGEALCSTGAVEVNFQPAVADSAEKLVANAEAILIALPAYGHKSVFDAIAPHIAPTQTIVISSHASFGALYLSRLLAARGVVATIVAWGTTVVTARQLSPTEVKVSSVRKRIDLATVPAADSAKGLSVCQELFGDRFVDRKSLLAIALSNLNPQNHMGIALGNMTRMERGETWFQAENVTPNVGRLLEKLDLERLAIAASLGLEVRTIFEHFHLSYHVPVSSVSQMNQTMHAGGHPGMGPTTADSRYVTEDVPFGLVVTARIGRLAGCPAELHEAGIRIFSAMYGRDFEAENDLISALEIESMSLQGLDDLCRIGFAAAARH